MGPSRNPRTHPGHGLFLPLLRGHLLELLVLPNDGKDVEVLPLVLVDTLDLRVKGTRTIRVNE